MPRDIGRRFALVLSAGVAVVAALTLLILGAPPSIIGADTTIDLFFRKPIILTVNLVAALSCICRNSFSLLTPPLRFFTKVRMVGARPESVNEWLVTSAGLLRLLAYGGGVDDP